MGCVKLKTDYEVISLERYVRENVYDPYNEPLDIEVESENRMTLINPGKWTVTLDSDEGSFTFKGEFKNYYDVDRLMSIRNLYGTLFEVLRFDIRKNNAYENRRFDQCLHQDHNRC